MRIGNITSPAKRKCISSRRRCVSGTHAWRSLRPISSALCPDTPHTATPIRMDLTSGAREQTPRDAFSRTGIPIFLGHASRYTTCEWVNRSIHCRSQRPAHRYFLALGFHLLIVFTAQNFSRNDTFMDLLTPASQTTGTRATAGCPP